MDSSSGRDKDSKSSPSESENPFVKFKNFADSQASAFLQGLIGLPSAFSKRASGDNQWAGFDEDLRRRDQLQVRQKLLEEHWRNTEALGASGNAVAAERESSPRQSPWHKSGSEDIRSKDQPSSPEKSQHKLDDLPLYSPVNIELFHHLSHTNPFTSSMGKVRYAMFSSLQQTPLLHSQYSLLPYLLYSPHSPIALDLEAEASNIGKHKKDTFQYCAAFEDLIRTSQGKNRTSGMNNITQHLSSALSYVPIPEVKAVGWIASLSMRGLLQQKEQVSDPDPDLQAWRNFAARHTAITELDVVEAIQGLISSSLPPSPFTWALANLGKEDSSQKSVWKETEAYQGPQQYTDGNGGTHVVYLVKDLERQGRCDANGKPKVPGFPKAPVFSPESEERVVSESTNTERTTHEDGTVETSITVWRRYDDGRETTTSTSHIEERGWSEGDENDWPVDRAAAAKTEQKSDKEEKKEKKGWFWN